MENSGKTTILNIIQTHKIIKDPRPTKWIQRTTFEINEDLFCIWDLGGLPFIEKSTY